MSQAARNVFCPADGCEAAFRTTDGLHDHIDRIHGGKSLDELRGVSRGRLTCPVNGCTDSFDGGEQLRGHVAGKAPHDPAHMAIRDSAFHEDEAYETFCTDDATEGGAA